MSGGGFAGSSAAVSYVLNGVLALGIWLSWAPATDSSCGASGVESAVRELRWTARLGSLLLLCLLGLLGWAAARGHLGRLSAAGGVVVHASAVSHGASWAPPVAGLAATSSGSPDAFYIGDEPTDAELAVYVPKGPRGPAK